MKSKKKRLIKKSNQPTEEFIKDFIGDDAWNRLMSFEDMLKVNYDLFREIKYPFGNDYGWGFRYSHKKKLLLYVFFEEDGFCCTISINDKGAKEVEAKLNNFLPKTQSLWENRYPCGELGGWIHYSVESDKELPDIISLIGVKVKPKRA